MYRLKIVLFYLYVAFVTVGSFFYALFRPRHPNNVYYIARLFGWGLKYLIGIRLEIKNAERLLSGKPTVYIANHQSNWDIFVWGSFISKGTVSVGKKEILYIPVFGLMYWLAGNVILNRQNKEKANRTLGSTATAIQTRQISIAIFPEGTRNRTKNTLLPFKKGAFFTAVEAQVPIVPVCIQRYDIVQMLKDKIRILHIHVLPALETQGMDEKAIPNLVETATLQMEAEIQRLNTALANSNAA